LAAEAESKDRELALVRKRLMHEMAALDALN